MFDQGVASFDPVSVIVIGYGAALVLELADLGGVDMAADHPVDAPLARCARHHLLVSGDEFDTIMLAHRWLAFVGDALYHLMMKLNGWVAGVRKLLGLPYWSISKAAKHKVKNAVEFISKYEAVVARAAGERGVDGVVCGHIHTAEIREFAHEGRRIEYFNDGDWVEGCNALVEHFDGRMELLHWPDEVARRDVTVASEEMEAA